MDYQMTRQEAIRNILQSQDFLDVVKELRENQLNRIIYSNEDDAKEREQAYVRVKTIDELMSYLESIAKDSEIKDKAWKIL
jgi:vacuolar-type H+-ATPase subunit C/Vma6